MSLQNKFLSKILSDKFWRTEISLSTAESCTSGAIASIITSIPGSSHYYKGGIIAYTDEVKINLLGVNPETIATKGVVSEETAIEMAKGAMKSMNSDCAVATTGFAGPTGGAPGIPVGTIWIAVATDKDVLTLKLEGDEGRNKNIENATLKALELLKKMFQNKENEG